MLKYVRDEIQCWNSLIDMWELYEVISFLPNIKSHQLRRGSDAGAWITVQTSKVNRTDLGAQEFFNYLFFRYGMEPLTLTNTFVTVVGSDSQFPTPSTARMEALSLLAITSYVTIL